MKVKRLSLAMLTIPMTMYDDEHDDDSDDDDDVVVVERALSHLSDQATHPPLCETTGGQTTSHTAPKKHRVHCCIKRKYRVHCCSGGEVQEGALLH